MSLCEAEKTYILHGVEDDFRVDGRQRGDYRPMELETNIIEHAFGSARFRLANTDILVAVKFEIDVPYPETPNEGKLEFFVDCSANATPAFEGRGGEDLATEISNSLNTAYRSARALDLTKLCICKGHKCWKMYIDILLLECGGNLYDAISLAVKSALFDTKIPKIRSVTVDGNNIDVDVSDNLSECERIDVSNVPVMEQSSWVTAISLLGLLAGNTILGQLQDLLGRKGLLLMATLPLTGTWLMIGFANSYEVLLAARFLNGVVTVVPTMTSAIYIGEIADPSIRGKLGMFNLCMIELGVVLTNTIGSYTSYLTTALIISSIPLIFLSIFIWMPESPYFYLRKGNMHKARKCLMRLRNNTNVEKELLDIELSVAKEMKEKGSILELATVARYRRAALICLGLKTLHQMSGLNAIAAYTKVIFEQVSTGMDPSHSSIIATGIAVPSVLIGSLLIDRLGRKPLYYLSTLGCCAALTLEFIYFFMQDYLHSDVSKIGFFPVSGIFFYNIFRSIGVQPLAIIITSEIFPTNIKAVGQNVVLAYSSLLGFLISLGFPILNDLAGIYTCFGIFAGCCFIGFCFIWAMLPETKGQSLSDIQNQIESVVQAE